MIKKIQAVELLSLLLPDVASKSLIRFAIHRENVILEGFRFYGGLTDCGLDC